MAEIQRSLYVDNLITGGSTVQEAQQIKSSAIKIFNEARFQLHKWNANAPELETPEALTNGEPATFAKEQLGVPQEGEATLLGLAWDKESDTISVKFPLDPAQPTKRGILGKVARVYDPLGLVSPMTLGGKLLYRDACNLRVAWDAHLPEEITHPWMRWESGLPERVTTPRAMIPLVIYRERIDRI